MKYLFARATKKRQLTTLLALLRPMSTGHPLIRIGAEADGGYLVPDDLDGIRQCFSPGVDIKSDFEFDCANRGMDVFMADASVEGPARDHPKFHFEKHFIGGFARQQMIDFADWVDRLAAPDGDLMLQMDIEGYEYEVLAAMPARLLSRFRIMVVEFHGLSRLLERSFYDLAFPVFEKLAGTHVCAHIHPNNYLGTRANHGLEIPDLVEFTFFRRDRAQTLMPALSFPHPLDRDCCARKPIKLPGCWYE